MLYNTLPSFSVLNALDAIREASQDTPFLTVDNIDDITRTFDMVIKVMGKGNINGNIKKLDTDCDAKRLMEARLARLMQEDLRSQVDLCIEDGTKVLIVFDGDNWQPDSPFTTAIVAFAKRLRCPVLSVRGKVTPDKWRPDHMNADGVPKCTVGTWPSDVTMRMVWVEELSPAEATLRMATRVVVYGAADLFLVDDAATATTTSKEMQRFVEFGVDPLPLSCCAENPSYWSVYGKTSSTVSPDKDVAMAEEYNSNLPEKRKKTTNKKKSEDDGAQKKKRGTTAFIEFSNVEYKKVLSYSPEMSFPEISKEVGAAWKSLDDEERKKWTTLANETNKEEENE